MQKSNPHKALLIKKSALAKSIIKSRIANAKNDIEALAAASLKVNDVLLEMHKKEAAASDFRTFREWDKAGFKIIKGSKSYRIWGTPKHGINKVEATKVSTGETHTLEQEYSFFPMCSLFNENQVERKECADQ